MNHSSQQQNEFNFNKADSRHKDGFEQWRRDREEAMRALARRQGLPIGHKVEIWLRGGIRLRGCLRLCEEELFVKTERDPDLVLRVERTSFRVREIESCLRLDD